MTKLMMVFASILVSLCVIHVPKLYVIQSCTKNCVSLAHILIQIFFAVEDICDMQPYLCLNGGTCIPVSNKTSLQQPPSLVRVEKLDPHLQSILPFVNDQYTCLCVGASGDNCESKFLKSSIQ